MTGRNPSGKTFAGALRSSDPAALVPMLRGSENASIFPKCPQCAQPSGEDSHPESVHPASEHSAVTGGAQCAKDEVSGEAKATATKTARSAEKNRMLGDRILASQPLVKAADVPEIRSEELQGGSGVIVVRDESRFQEYDSGHGNGETAGGRGECDRFEH